MQNPPRPHGVLHQPASVTALGRINGAACPVAGKGVMRTHRIFMRLRACAFAALPLLGCAGQPAVDPTEPPARVSFDAALIAKGAQLAAIGNCKDCHTASAGKPYAGGRPLKTQFGTIYAT